MLVIEILIVNFVDNLIREIDSHREIDATEDYDDENSHSESELDSITGEKTIINNINEEEEKV
jgi:hypothetical protein